MSYWNCFKNVVEVFCQFFSFYKCTYIELIKQKKRHERQEQVKRKVYLNYKKKVCASDYITYAINMKK